MDTEIVKSKDGKDYNRFNEEVIICNLCYKNKTTALATKRCDSCWELESRIHYQPKLAKKILENMNNG